MQKVRTNSFQEVLEAVLFGGWSIPPTAHGWLLCGSPTRVSTTFILCGKDIVRIDMYIKQCVSLVFLFWGGSWKISSELVVPREWVGSLKFESHLGKLLRDGCACSACVKFTSRVLKGHIVWYHLRLHVGDHLRSI